MEAVEAWVDPRDEKSTRVRLRRSRTRKQGRPARNLGARSWGSGELRSPATTGMVGTRRIRCEGGRGGRGEALAFSSTRYRASRGQRNQFQAQGRSRGLHGEGKQGRRLDGTGLGAAAEPQATDGRRGGRPWRREPAGVSVGAWTMRRAGRRRTAMRCLDGEVGDGKERAHSGFGRRRPRHQGASVTALEFDCN